MKIYTFLVFAAVVVYASAGKKCKISSECEEDECCLMRYKIDAYKIGECTKLTGEGGRCNYKSFPITVHEERRKASYEKCPCARDLKCQPLVLEEVEEEIYKLRKLQCRKETVEPEIIPLTKTPEVTDAPAE